MISWYSRSPDHYVTHGAAVRRVNGQWFAQIRDRAAGPISNLDRAMEVAVEMLQREEKPDAK